MKLRRANLSVIHLRVPEQKICALSHLSYHHHHFSPIWPNPSLPSANVHSGRLSQSVTFPRQTSHLQYQPHASQEQLVIRQFLHIGPLLPSKILTKVAVRFQCVISGLRLRSIARVIDHQVSVSNISCVTFPILIDYWNKLV